MISPNHSMCHLLDRDSHSVNSLVCCCLFVFFRSSSCLQEHVFFFTHGHLKRHEAAPRCTRDAFGGCPSAERQRLLDLAGV